MKELLSAVPGMVGIRLEEEPEFQVLIDDDAFQVRRYQPMVLAETVVPGTRDQAADEGFRRLAGYIFGGNQTKHHQSQNQSLPMTTPVLQSEQGEGLKIA